jgi:hypothetical protein
MKKIPLFKTELEEIKFWESRSAADYWGGLTECTDTFKLPKLKPVALKFNPLVIKKVKLLAKKREKIFLQPIH